MATLTMGEDPGAGAGAGAGAGLPLQLTTITVAVPGSPLSPGGAMLGSLGHQLAGHSAEPGPAPNKWKYEQPKADKVGTTLVRFPVSAGLGFWAGWVRQKASDEAGDVNDRLHAVLVVVLH